MYPDLGYPARGEAHPIRCNRGDFRERGIRFNAVIQGPNDDRYFSDAAREQYPSVTELLLDIEVVVRARQRVPGM